MKYIFSSIVVILLLVGCSTTKKLPKGEVLYTGISELKINEPESGEVNDETKSQVDKALEVAPNNALFGSSTMRIPFPFGLWMYNWFYTEKEKGFKKWMFDKLASKPVLISDVEPSLRSGVAETLMDDDGYFNGTVTSDIIYDPKNPRKAKVSYNVTYNKPYAYDSIAFVYEGMPCDSIIASIWPSSLLKKGELFNVNNLEAERTRIADYLRDNGYYYFRPDFITYEADSTIGNNKIDLRLSYAPGLPKMVLKPWRIGDITFEIADTEGNALNDSVQDMGIEVKYANKQPVRTKVLKSSLAFETGDFFSQKKILETQSRLSWLNTFQFTEMLYMPKDTNNTIDSLNVRIDATLDLPFDGEIEMNVASKSNKQVGPGMRFGVTKRNVFGGGEVFNTELRGSYEWNTGNSAQNQAAGKLLNSYEFGVKSSLTLPRLIAPKFMHRDNAALATTTAKVDASLMARASFFKLLNITGEGSYNFSSSKVSTHEFVPFGLTYSYLLDGTATFDSIMANNKALFLSFENQFVPYMSYTYTFDNSAIRTGRNQFWWQGTVKQAGNILFGAMSIFKKGTDKKLLGRPFSQFVNFTSDFRYTYYITKKQQIATRFYAGVVKAYLNSKIAPYSEQYYIGGANSLRAFGVRSVGPGGYYPDTGGEYSFLDQTGDMKLEVNIEYRFPLFGDLYGAVFMDAGNIWKLDTDRPEERFNLKTFPKEVALGTGLGLRYDITYLVLRFDIGVPIHYPYETSKEGYYNSPHFWKNLAYHFAIGYPF